MKGYYAIYNHQKNAWWTQGNWWLGDTPYESHQMPTNYQLTKWWTADGDEKYELQKNDLKDVLILNRNKEKNPYNIFVFETLKEAEDYLLNGGIYKEHNDYFTIRKIYY
jgi:hypothetical protein